MTISGKPLDLIESRLAEWILYRLRGGKPEVLERILDSNECPPDRKYDLLRSILTDHKNGLEGVLRDEDRDLLIGANHGYTLDPKEKHPDDQAWIDAIGSLAKSAKVDFLLSKDAVLRRRGAFRDQAGRLVDVDLTISRAQFRRLVGDLLYRISQERSNGKESTDGVAPDTPAFLVDERSRSLLGYLLDQELPEPSEISTLPTSPGGVLDRTLPQDEPAPYVTQLLFRDIAILISQPQAEWDSYAEQGTNGAHNHNFSEKHAPFVDLDPSQVLQQVSAAWQLPRKFKSYEVEDVLSVGSRALTLRALDKDSLHGQHVVLRILRPGYLTGCIHVPSLRRHRTILPYERLLSEGTFVFFVSEYMSGGNLGNILNDLSGPKRLQIIFQALNDVCEALVYAHERGIFHAAIAPEKILYSPSTGRFMLAHFQLSLAALPGSRSIAIQERRRKAAQNDIHDLAALFKALLVESQISWLKYILEDCLRGKVANVQELLDRINRYLQSEQVLLIVLTARFNADTQTILYNLDIGGSRHPEILDLGVNHRMISDLYARCDLLGELALRRAKRIRDCAPVVEIDREIRKTIEEVSENATHFFFGSRIQSELERHQEATLWVMYDPCLAAIPWELLEIGQSHVCRHFHAARSPLLINHTHHPGLQTEDKIRFLFIENPDGDLEGATKECQKLAEVVKSSPLGDRINIETVNQRNDSLTIRSKMLHSDIIHFAGHGRFRATYTEDSGLSLGCGDILQARWLKDFWRDGTPFLVFANACNSGKANQQNAQQRVYSDAATGLGQAFLAVGVGNYIGTLWKAPDGDVTIDFAVDFYRWFLSGCTVSRAIRAARDLSIKKYGEENLTWARYVLFGNPLNRIRI